MALWGATVIATAVFYRDLYLIWSGWCYSWATQWRPLTVCSNVPSFFIRWQFIVAFVIRKSVYVVTAAADKPESDDTKLAVAFHVCNCFNCAYGHAPRKSFKQTQLMHRTIQTIWNSYKINFHNCLEIFQHYIFHFLWTDFSDTRTFNLLEYCDRRKAIFSLLISRWLLTCLDIIKRAFLFFSAINSPNTTNNVSKFIFEFIWFT